MDHFGIGSGIRGCVHAYMQLSRGTGRTTSLVDSLKSGDRVVFASGSEAKRVLRLCQERGVTIEAVVVDPENPESLFNRGSLAGDGRCIFDHTWVELFYYHAIDRCAQDLDKLQTTFSGYGEPHRKTRRRYEESPQIPTRFEI